MNNSNNNQNNPLPINLPNMSPQIPNNQPMNTTPQMNQFQVNQNMNQMNTLNQNNSDINLINNQNNKFINFDSNQNEASLTDLNVDGSYNQLEGQKYLSDPNVIKNINETKKKSVPISKELKTVIIITVFLLVFIIIMPMIFEFINDIRFN